MRTAKGFGCHTGADLHREGRYQTAGRLAANLCLITLPNGVPNEFPLDSAGSVPR
jgi:hypothetical protein